MEAGQKINPIDAEGFGRNDILSVDRNPNAYYAKERKDGIVNILSKMINAMRQ